MKKKTVKKTTKTKTAKAFLDWCMKDLDGKIETQEFINEELRERGFAIPEKVPSTVIVEGLKDELTRMYNEFVKKGVK